MTNKQPIDLDAKVWADGTRFFVTPPRDRNRGFADESNAEIVQVAEAFKEVRNRGGQLGLRLAFVSL